MNNFARLAVSRLIRAHVGTYLSYLALLLGGTALTTQPLQAQQLDDAIVLGTTLSDRACILSLTDGDTVIDTFATFEVCEHSWVGQRVALTYETVTIPAATCQGAPDCQETESVSAVTQVVPFMPPERATIAGLVTGDRACYVDLIDDAGQRHSQFASFEICEQDILYQTVDLSYDMENIVAFICNGNIDCGLSERALLITRATVVAVVAPPRVDIAALPDGSYRYWSQPYSSAIITDAELLQHPESTLFLFRKQGNNIVGTWSYVDGEAICVAGQVNGNTVAGLAVQTLSGATVLSGDATFADFGPAQRLQVRQGRAVAGDIVRYDSALLNLHGLHRINAGDALPPSDCD